MQNFSQKPSKSEYPLHTPIFAVEAAQTNRLCYMAFCDISFAVKVGNGSCKF